MVGIILAAGKGTRMRSKLPKALHPICGKPMTRHIIEACKSSGISDLVVVTGHDGERVRTELGADVRYAEQHEQLGTGDACRQALEVIDDSQADVLVMPGDTPLVNAETLSLLCAAHTSSGADATVLTTVLANPASYGRIVRGDDGRILAIVEASDASQDQSRLNEINTGIYCFKLQLIREYISQVRPSNIQQEFYLTDIIGMMVSRGRKVGAVESDYSDVVLGINNRVDLANVSAIMRRRILDRLMLDGVTVIDPSSTYVDSDVMVGRDTVIYPQTVLERSVELGEDCIIGPSSRLVNVKVGNRASIVYSHVVDSVIDDGARVGPFANIRPGCKIGRNAKIGNFVETKNSIIEDSVSAGHLSYLGDASIGEGTNIDAGTITCNYDGYAKHRTNIGKNIFVGSHTTIVAPLTIGDGAVIAAGSTITKDVPPDALAIARSRQTVRDGWARIRRERKRESETT